ncbi:histidine kinase [Salibacteraceae bacterium]|nr:histidine kinase [Salibacteraceae bacterium]
MNASRNYYKAQIVGWSGYVLISTGVFIMSGKQINISAIGGIYLVFALGLILSHLYRGFIIKMSWLEKDLFRLVPRVLISCILLAIGFHGIYIGIGNFTFNWNMEFRWNDPNLFAWGMLFFIWNLIYFAYIFFQRYRTEEIKNLKLEAARNEYELRRLRDQMNPHFIFNAMNTIRALIDEDPIKAKNAVTQLSNVLRSSLQTGKQELITLEKEIQIVRDYLEIEKARYEERLIVELEIDPASMSSKIPPLILQTIVENCIKHGIAKLPKGGTIKVETKKAEDHVKIDIINDGQFDPSKKSDSSLGLENTRNRLDLSFGKSAWLTIGNLNEFKVRTQIYLPIKNTI